MPTSYTFRGGGIPGVLSTSAPSSSVLFAYLADDGDDGFKEAIRIYWAIKSMKVTISASATYSSGPSNTFSYEVTYPGDTGAHDSYATTGTIVGYGPSTNPSPDPLLFVEPPFRPYSNISNNVPVLINCSSSKEVSASPLTTYSIAVSLSLRYYLGKYILVLSAFECESGVQFPAGTSNFNSISFQLGIPPPPSGTRFDVETGSVDIFGYSFDYYCVSSCHSASETSTITSQSITITSESWA
jgi:hypothetical protein